MVVAYGQQKNAGEYRYAVHLHKLQCRYTPKQRQKHTMNLFSKQNGCRPAGGCSRMTLFCEKTVKVIIVPPAFEENS